jgi:hypothetical protein
MDADRATQTLEFLTKHFVVVSAFAVVVSSLCATVFVYAYLSSFDWRLIWIVEYSDIFKASLAALGFLSTAAITISTFISIYPQVDAQTIYKWMWQAIAGFAALGGLFVVILGIFAPNWQPLFWFFASLISVYWTCGHIAITLKQLPDVTINQLMGLGTLVTMTTVTLGWTFAAQTLDTAGYDVILKTERLEDVGLVMATSHHTSSRLISSSAAAMQCW